MTNTVNELLEAADVGWKSLHMHGETRDANRLRAAVEAVRLNTHIHQKVEKYEYPEVKR